MSEPDDLGPKPEARTEPAEPPPGGPDAVDQGAPPEPTVPDLSPDLNPSTQGEATPDEIREGEDTSTEATEAGSDEFQEPDQPEEESPV